MTERLDKLETAPATRYVIVDLEATCWKAPASGPNEIIEIGSVAYEVGAGVLGEFQTFVRPQLRPTLSEFCTELTTIRQDNVDGAPAFAEAYAAFVQWMATWRPAVLASWGNYDLNQIGKDCRRHRLETRIDRHANLKVMFGDLSGYRKCGMARALRVLGIAIEGTHHRGIDDARNIARILEWMLEAQSERT